MSSKKYKEVNKSKTKKSLPVNLMTYRQGKVNFMFNLTGWLLG